MSRLSIALCDDFREERWPSMDRVAAMLAAELSRNHGGAYAVAAVCPLFRTAATAMPLAQRSPAAFKVDRLLNRFWRYPRHLRTLRGRFDVFHIVDHSYAHLVHALPAERTVVTCHDLDAFRCVLDPVDDPRSAPFRRLTKRIADGLGRAARVVCDTETVRGDLVAAGLVSADRIVVAPLGVEDSFFAGPIDAVDGDGPLRLLHVGSTAPRKRIDLLLRVCGALRHGGLADLRLIRIGDPLTAEQRRLARDVGIADCIEERGGLDERQLADAYRRASIVLQPSDREGFGLPVVEALAAGTPVVATDLRVLREVGGDAVMFCPAGDVDAWCAAIRALARERTACPARWRARREAGRMHARRFTWARCAEIVAGVYDEVAAIRT